MSHKTSARKIQESEQTNLDRRQVDDVTSNSMTSEALTKMADTASEGEDLWIGGQIVSTTRRECETIG